MTGRDRHRVHLIPNPTLLSPMKSLACGILSISLLSMLSAQTPDPAKTAAAKMDSMVIDPMKLVPKPTKTGERRDVFDAPTVTLDKFHCHITKLNPGENTGALHRHPQ
jgi:hypothetical protein